MVSRGVLASAGVVVDRLLGEPPSSLHPVAGFGRVMRVVERGMYRDARVPGVAHAAIGAGFGLAAGGLVGSTTVATWLAVAGRALSEAAMAVGSALDAGDLP